jgi:tRNA (cmo5U34)-methyltransferase
MQDVSCSAIADTTLDTRRNSSLGHIPGKRWEFDESVTVVFDDMLARSIPYLSAMRETVFRTACHFVQPGSYVIDLGCSLGGAMAPLIEKFHANNHFLGVEASEPMVVACRDRFTRLINEGIVEIQHNDLRSSYPCVDASVTLCILTLMFTPIEYRFRILANAFEHTLAGGAFILVEKVLGMDAEGDDLLVNLYYQYKREMGYTEEEVYRKRCSLEGVLVPVTAAWNEQMLRTAGFQHVECFWRSLNFCAWVGVHG